ncbi:hypothetical protein GCK32_009193 [Trichostrongylus colubriformis]|uniref:Uncharacterized protein n=1 Tax=Trichostrongylus colubriformis TaxID=6319 RepID=A0AAN8FU99_TRICO
MRELPLVASILGGVPAIVEQLPRDNDRAILIREHVLRTLHKTLSNVLNIAKLKKLRSDGRESPLTGPIVGYFCINYTLVSGSIMDLIIIRNERFLKGLGVGPRRAMPLHRRLPLAGSSMLRYVRQTLILDLLGKEL